MRIVVVGATKNFFKVGHATFRVLHRTRPDVRLRLAIPDIVDARRAVGEIPIELMSWDPARPETLRAALRGCTAMLMVPPIDKRIQVARAYVDAAADAGTRYVLCLGIQHPGDRCAMGREVDAVSGLLTGSAIRHDVLRLPMFLENLLYQVPSISERGEFCYPVRGDAPFSYVACGDLAEVFSQLLLSPPDAPLGETFWSASSPLTCDLWADHLSAAAGARVRFRRISGDEFVAGLVSRGMSEHASTAVLELWQLIDRGLEPTPTDALRRRLGRSPLTALEWTLEHRCCFRPGGWPDCRHPKPPRAHMV
jgi:uncharacterized protein YbjT (DUF2867 family)